jgi:hypothetical protein
MVPPRLLRKLRDAKDELARRKVVHEIDRAVGFDECPVCGSKRSR